MKVCELIEFLQSLGEEHAHDDVYIRSADIELSSFVDSLDSAQLMRDNFGDECVYLTGSQVPEWVLEKYRNKQP